MNTPEPAERSESKAQRPVLAATAALVAGSAFGGAAGLAWRGDRRTGSASTGAGSILIAWIAVQLAFIRQVSFLHPLFAVIGSLFVVAGRRQQPQPT